MDFSTNNAPSNATRRDRKRRDTREALIHAAMDLFEEKGFAATTIDDITERADVARRTFFRHFQSKESVLLIDPDEYTAQLAELFATLPTPLTFGQLVDHLWHAVQDAVNGDPDRRRRSAIIMQSELNIGQAAWGAFSAIRTAAVAQVQAGASDGQPADETANTRLEAGLSIAFVAICNAYLNAIGKDATDDEFEAFNSTMMTYDGLIDRDAILVNEN